MSTANVKRRRWFYSGDVNIEHGGMFYRLDTFDDGWVDVVRVQPCSDAGGPDNQFWLEELTVPIDRGAEYALCCPGDTPEQQQAHCTLHDVPYPTRVIDALRCCGWDTRIEDYRKLTQAKRRHALVEALVSYGLYDKGDASATVQLGPKPAPCSEQPWSLNIDRVLRANVNLRAYVRREFCS